jgi:hypothetical protein
MRYRYNPDSRMSQDPCLLLLSNIISMNEVTILIDHHQGGDHTKKRACRRHNRKGRTNQLHNTNPYQIERLRD